MGLFAALQREALAWISFTPGGPSNIQTNMFLTPTPNCVLNVGMRARFFAFPLSAGGSKSPIAQCSKSCTEHRALLVWHMLHIQVHRVWWTTFSLPEICDDCSWEPMIDSCLAFGPTENVRTFRIIDNTLLPVCWLSFGCHVKSMICTSHRYSILYVSHFSVNLFHGIPFLLFHFLQYLKRHYDTAHH